MKKIFFTPGPSQLYPTVARHIDEGLKNDVFSLSHRDDFMLIFQETVTAIKKLFSVPEDYHVVFVSSGTEAMERVIENCVAKESFHLVNGAFSERFFNIAKELKKSPQQYEVPWGKGFNFSQIEIPRTTELLCITQNETSTGVALPLVSIYEYKKQYPNMLIALDIVSSVPYLDIDYRYIDCAFFSVQKGFGLPAGLGVIIISPQAVEKAVYLQNKHSNIGSYHNFPHLISYANKYQTPETPNTLNIYLLGKVLVDMQHVGIKILRKYQEEKTDLLYDFFDNHESYKPFVQKEDRSQTIIVIDVKNQTQKILSQLKEKGFIVGSGYGKYKDTHIRIAQFPAHSVGDITKLLGAFVYV